MLTEKDKRKLKELQNSFKEIVSEPNSPKALHKIENIEKKMNEILSKASLLERLCTKEIIFDSNKNIYKLLTRPVNLAYATQDPVFVLNEDFQKKFEKVMVLRKDGFRFLDCFRIKGHFDEDGMFICTRIKLCDKYDTDGNEYLKVDFKEGHLSNGIIEKRKKGTISYEELAV